MSISLILSLCSIGSFGFGSAVFLGRTIYRATIYLERIEATLAAMNESIQQLEKRDSRNERRIEDIQSFLAKEFGYVARR